MTTVLRGIALASLLVGACEGGSSSSGSSDDGIQGQDRVDAGRRIDGGPSGTGSSPDAAGPDAASPDAASPDAASPDAASPDAAGPDAASPDAAGPDAASPDANSPDANSPDAASPDANTAPAPLVSVTFTESSEDLVNPERGYYVGYNIRAAGSAAFVRAGGHSIALAQVFLDAYRDLPLDAALLTSLRAGFGRVREAGIKVILRFQYNQAMAPDASRARILGHIAQLAPLLQENADVIAVLQAGFIGAWGEWHSSTNGLDNPTDRAAILDALLAALPASRQVAVRTPMFKAAYAPGGALTATEAYGATARARLGHHNDCFLASASDFGTYAAPVSTWQAYVAGDGRYTAIGGETCAVYTARTACAPAIAEMTSNHWSYLNSQYNLNVLAGWTTGGCAVEIDRRLGYRFSLARVARTSAVAPGGELALEVDVRNTGFASPFNQRPVEIVLSSGASRRVVRLAGVDARRWAAGTTSTLAVRLRIPADVPPGMYTLALRLPDAAATLADPRYAIRLANTGVWSDATGDNVLTSALAVDAAAPGPRDPDAAAFVQLP